MGRAWGWLVAALLIAAVGGSGCGSSHHGPATPAVSVAHLAGSLVRVTLSPEAVTRIGLRTAPAGRSPDPADTAVIPYAAVVYDADGNASVFTSLSPREYIRRPIRIDHISGSLTYVKHGLSPGTSLVTVGAVELLGAETGVEG